jgi:hypothetical protein
MTIIDVLNQINELSLKEIADALHASNSVDVPEISTLIQNFRQAILSMREGLKEKHPEVTIIAAEQEVPYLSDNVAPFCIQVTDSFRNQTSLVEFMVKMELLEKILKKHRLGRSDQEEDQDEELAYYVARVKESVVHVYLENVFTGLSYFQNEDVRKTIKLEITAALQNALVTDVMADADKLNNQVVAEAAVDGLVNSFVRAAGPQGPQSTSFTDADAKDEAARIKKARALHQEQERTFFQRHGGKFALAGFVIGVAAFVTASVLSAGLVPAIIGLAGLGALGVAAATPVAIAIGVVVTAVVGSLAGLVMSAVVSKAKGFFSKILSNKKAKKRADDWVDPGNDNDRPAPVRVDSAPVSQDASSSTARVMPALQDDNSHASVRGRQPVRARSAKVMRVHALECYEHRRMLLGPDGNIIKAVEGAVISAEAACHPDLMERVLKTIHLKPELKNGHYVLVANMITSTSVDADVNSDPVVCRFR